MINLNKPETLTHEAVAKLLGSKGDSDHRQIRVMDNGDVVLSDDVGTANLKGVKFQFETFSAGTDHVGSSAAKDTKLVDRIYRALEHNWKSNFTGYLDSF